MDYRKVTAIIRPEVLDEVEARLEAGGVRGITVTPVRGSGKMANHGGGDPKVDCVRVAVFTAAERG